MLISYKAVCHFKTNDKDKEGYHMQYWFPTTNNPKCVCNLTELQNTWSKNKQKTPKVHSPHWILITTLLK